MPRKSLRAEEIADNLEQYFSEIGIPKVIRSDMPSFKSELMDALCMKLNIQQRFSAPFHFALYGSVKRVQGINEMTLEKFLQENPIYWDKMLPFLSFALRNVRHTTTGFSASEIHKLDNSERNYWTFSASHSSSHDNGTEEYRCAIHSDTQTVHYSHMKNSLVSTVWAAEQIPKQMICDVMLRLNLPISMLCGQTYDEA